MQAIDFPSLAGLAMRRLGWSPDMFWAATPADMRMALGTGASQLRAALKPDELEA
ncbi:hypothetical protein JCM17844_07080 [Iodidimonas gelatinilytica]|nr:phage tail assembly chaperone [Iodidimonas gelatinilytica]GEQ97071.1 hypothetical protein JCM17844_07080 [Iodidimonas gelatinilytica]